MASSSPRGQWVKIWQAITCHYSCARGLSVASEKCWKTQRSCDPTIHCSWGNPNLNLDQPITKECCQPIATDSPNTTRLGLCCGLTKPVLCKIIPPHIHHHSWGSSHDDIMKWKHFPRYWPFVRGIHRSPVNSLHKGQWRAALMCFLSSVLEYTVE